MLAETTQCHILVLIRSREKKEEEKKRGGRELVTEISATRTKSGKNIFLKLWKCAAHEPTRYRENSISCVLFF